MNPTVTLRLDADNSRLVPAVRASDAELKRLGATAGTTGDQARRGAAGISSIGTAADSTARRVSAVSSALASARATVATYIGAQTAGALISVADNYANISARLKLATDGHKAYATASAQVFNISQRTATALDSTATLYARLSQSTAEYGITQQRQLALTESINKTFAISGASNVATANTIVQLSQALAGGVLRAEEFNSVVENSPRLAKALADGMGLSMGELRKHVNDGKVTVDQMVAALENQSSVIAAEFEQIPLTVGRAMELLRNSVTKFVGESSQELGASGGIAQGIAFLANNMQHLDQIAGVLAVALGSRLVVSLARATAEKITAAAASRALAREELAAARIAEQQAAGRLSAARAGMSVAGGVAAAEQAVAAAQLRTAAAAQAASVALTAKAAAMRGLNAAMGAFGGPAGLAITALSLFVAWAMNSNQKAQELSKTVTAGFQPAMRVLQEFNQQTANTSFAELSNTVETIEAARQEIKNLGDEYERLAATRRSFQARDRALPFGFDKELEGASAAIESARLRLDNLTKGYDRAISVSASLVLRTANVTDATDAQRRSLEELLKRQANQGQTLEQTRPLLEQWAKDQLGVDNANRIAAASFDTVASAARNSGAAIKAALQSVNEGLDKQIQSVQLDLIEKTQGKAARMRAQFITESAQKGLDPTSSDYQLARAKNEQLIQLTMTLDKQNAATRDLTRTQTEAKRSGEQAARLAEQQADSQAKYTRQAALAAAELSGPMAAAQEQHKQRIAELDRELAKHLITQEAYASLVKSSAAELAKNAAEVTKQQQAPTALLDTLSGEVQLLGMVGIERERRARQLRNEQDMLQAINEANKAGAGINAEATAGLMAQARAWANASIRIEQQTADLEEWANVGTRGVADVADMLADMFSGGLDKSESFFSRLKDIFKRGWRDIVRTMLEQNLVRPFQDALTNAMNGALAGVSRGQADGNWLSKIAGMFGGGNQGGAGSGWMSSLANMIGGGRNLTGTNAMLAGGGWRAGVAAPGKMMGFGNNVGGFIGTGAAGGGAASASMAVPIIGWVVAAMMKNAELFDQGWDIANGESWAGKIATLGAVGHVDKMARKLGLNAKAASILSGSSIHAALFGRKKPQIQAQGLTGSYGFDGFAGQSYADIKAKGGLFRSDKKWTEYGQVDTTITDAFSQATGRARAGVISLAEQLGVDINSQLSSVRVDLGKVQLDADPDKAQAQLEQLITGAAKNLTGRGVSILGFGDFLNKGFEAGDVMNSLAASIELMTGNAQELGRALNAQEIDLVKRTTTMFQRMAKAAGTTMEEQVKAITTAASSYGSVVGNAQQEIATDGFSGFAKSLLAVRQEEQERIRTLQQQAKALGGLAVREQDLATVRQAAQLKADALARSLESELVGLALNRVNDEIERLGGSIDGTSSKLQDFINSLKLSSTLSPDTDTQKRSTASDLMQSAASAGNLESFTQYAQQFLEVSRKLNASGQGYQVDYAQVLELAKRFGGDGTAASLQQLYAQKAALEQQQEAAARLERAQRIAQGVADLAGARGGDPLEILRNVTGISAEALAKDLGLTTDELAKYLQNQQTDITDLAEILFDLPKRIAQEMVTVLTDSRVPVPASAAPGGGGTPAAPAAPVAPGRGYTDPSYEVLLQVRDGIQSLARQGEHNALMAL
ncbi:TPA: tape measure protein [Stenotrophomonas maltophilia]|nr:tape measure protein [Stenotrophomonas maltophilia]